MNTINISDLLVDMGPYLDYDAAYLVFNNDLVFVDAPTVIDIVLP